ncbi:MAG TPA: cyclic nucleotide-binding domain-containing protein [Gaiellaceae bacterium]|nr:cyclic nucleotide-binding domain-containing protein [Gaiellaceae bacterium]
MSQVGAGPAGRAAISLPRETGRSGADWAQVLAEVPLFGNLRRRHVKRIASLGRMRRYGPGTSIVRAGDAGTAFFVLIDGTARVIPAKGRARRLGAGDFFGEMALLDDSPRSADVVADGEVRVMTISGNAFGKLLRSEPALSNELLRTLAARLRAAEKTV